MDYVVSFELETCYYGFGIVLTWYCMGVVGVSNPGVPEPTSKLSPRAPAQMGRRETEREGGREAGGRQA
jgi:hypothetical protein